MARSMSPCPVMTITSVEGSIALMRFSTSTPFMPGILMSVRTIGGLSRPKTSSPSWPFSAVNTS